MPGLTRFLRGLHDESKPLIAVERRTRSLVTATSSEGAPPKRQSGRLRLGPAEWWRTKDLVTNEWWGRIVQRDRGEFGRDGQGRRGSLGGHMNILKIQYRGSEHNTDVGSAETEAICKFAG